MQVHRIKSGDVELHVTDQGPKDAPVILLIHGWAQSHICWRQQNPLAENHRLVALDLRGHGASDAPQDVAAYTDTAKWGDDINAVIKTLDLSNPMLVGWSYGARVVASYLDTYGEADIAGVVLAGGILTIGAAREDWMVGPASPGTNRDLYTDDDGRRLAATTEFVTNCATEWSDMTFCTELIAANMQVSALVRRALFAANWDFRPVFANFSKPALIIHGVEDQVVEPATGISASEIFPNADLVLFEETGHAPFLEDPERFNAELTAFATTLFGAAA